MTFLAGALALLLMWWFGRDALRRYPALSARLVRQVGGYVALAAAGLLLVRGRIEIALLLGAGAVWLLEGKHGLTRRARGLAARYDPRRLIGATIRFDAEGEGVALVGPHAGRSLATIPLSGLLALFGREAETNRRLEAYLDGRHPGWRVDAEADADARARRPAYPGAMTEQQAYEILGLERGASLEQVRAAHRTLMKRLHPDQGGTAEQAARVNAARDRLYNRHR
ncbi:J domain-containing protein [Methylobacterium sp. J-068]|uniref:J domain-containing protein n=1 Tax=Methylobacterium sp. J-068 TaxID=2836649 RepID=UPI001FBBB29B|nr:DnaJ domain-containing protein [Methylobacterium sp. J-068]MCJ2035453.1 DnaJ domain-containing protein [Methylobacterium sp. J-068]